MSRIVAFFFAGALVAGCSGAPISLEHYSEDQGQTPPIPQPGGAGPSLYKPAFELPTDGFTISTPLPELLVAYRLMLLDQAHPLPAGLAEQYVDAEIEILHERYTSQDKGLRTELIRRLRPTIARPGTTAELGKKPPLYPSDSEAARSEPERRAP